MKPKSVMPKKNEKKITTIIHHGEVKEWTGESWVVVRKATKRDFERYPEICRDEL